MLETIRRLGDEPDFNLRILQNLSGPKIRLSNIRDRMLESGATVQLISDSKEINDVLPINYKYLLEDIPLANRYSCLTVS